MLDHKFSRPPAELARENFPTAWHANCKHDRNRITDRATDTVTDTATKKHKWAAVKSPLGAQTVLGDRHEPVV